MISDGYKDRLFCMLFGSEEYKENILSLYNALCGTEHTDVNDIKIIIDKENVTLISSKSINLVDSQLNEFLLDYKNMIGKKMKVSICENCKEYDY